jgi:hypothetical protein
VLRDRVQRDAVLVAELPPRDPPIPEQAQYGVLLAIELRRKLRAQPPYELEAIHQHLHLSVSGFRGHDHLHVRRVAKLREMY